MPPSTCSRRCPEKSSCICPACRTSFVAWPGQPTKDTRVTSHCAKLSRPAPRQRPLTVGALSFCTHPHSGVIGAATGELGTRITQALPDRVLSAPLVQTCRRWLQLISAVRTSGVLAQPAAATLTRPGSVTGRCSIGRSILLLHLGEGGYFTFLTSLSEPPPSWEMGHNRRSPSL